VSPDKAAVSGVPQAQADGCRGRRAGRRTGDFAHKRNRGIFKNGARLIYGAPRANERGKFLHKIRLQLRRRRIFRDWDFAHEDDQALPAGHIPLKTASALPKRDRTKLS